MSELVSELVTRSPIELFWTAKKSARSRQIGSAQEKTWPSSPDFSDKKSPSGKLAFHTTDNTEYSRRMILCVKSLYKYPRERVYLQFTWGEYDKDCIDKSGNKIALSGGSECFRREECRGGS